jgi:hypothetical protein
MASGQYEYLYQLARNSDGTFSIVGSVDSSDQVNPLATNVQVSASSSTVADNHFFYANLFGVTEEFRFIDVAYDASFGEGYVAEFAPGGKPDGQYYFLTNQKYLGPGGLDTTDASKLGDGIHGVPFYICFMQGTRILSPGGEIAVENLRPGDLVFTSDHRSVPVRWIGCQTVSRTFSDELRLPVRVKTGALAENVPCRDLLISPDHALFVNGLLIQAGALVNGTSIVRELNVPMIFKYYHVETDDHLLILAENAPAETFVDNVDRAGFDNWEEYRAIYPEGKTIAEMPYPRAKAYRQVPQVLRENLVKRGRSLYRAEVPSAA